MSVEEARRLPVPELDETVCPVCGKNLTHPNLDMSIWAVAHYLAHIVALICPPQ